MSKLKKFPKKFERFILRKFEIPNLEKLFLKFPKKVNDEYIEVEKKLNSIYYNREYESVSKLSLHNYIYSNLAGYLKKQGFSLKYDIVKRPKRPQKLMKNTKRIEKLGSRSISEVYSESNDNVKDSLISEFKNELNRLKNDNHKLILMVKLVSGLDFKDIVNLKIQDLGIIAKRIVILKERGKTEVEGLSPIPLRLTKILVKHIEKLEKFYEGTEVSNFYIFPSENPKIEKLNSKMNSRSLSEIFEIGSKTLRTLTKSIVLESSNDVNEKEIISNIILRHKIDIPNRYKELRDTELFMDYYIRNLESDFEKVLFS